VLGLIH
jgi:hypothetical protein